MRLGLLVLLACTCLTACTLLESRDGLVGPPLADDAGLDATVAGDASFPSAAGNDASPADAAAGPTDAPDLSDAPPLDDAAPPPSDAPAPSVDAGPSPIYTGLLSPLGIAVYNGTICWVEGETSRMIRCAPAAGGAASAITTVASQTSDPLVDQAFDVALDDTYWYWSNGPNNQIVRKAMSGGVSAQYFTGDQRLSYIVLDGDDIWATDYVAGATSGNIVVGPSGTSSMLIFPGETLAAGVAIYAGSTYWGRGSPGSVSFALESGNTTITRVASAGAVTGLALDAAGTAYFISGDQQVFKLAQGASTPVPIYDAGAPFGDSDLAVDDTWIYWSETQNGTILRVAK